MRDSIVVCDRTRASTGMPASSPWYSPTCHCRANNHSGSNTRALRLTRMSACRERTSRCVQLVIEGLAPSGGSGGGGGGGGITGSIGCGGSPGSPGSRGNGSPGSPGSPGRILAMALPSQLREVGRDDFVVGVEGEEHRGHVVPDFAERFGIDCAQLREVQRLEEH